MAMESITFAEWSTCITNIKDRGVGKRIERQAYKWVTEIESERQFWPAMMERVVGV